MEEEEALRERVLAELTAKGKQFRSATSDVLEYAVYLGMQLDEDQELLWIADTALQAEDPEGWVQQESPSGDTYYVNEVTKQVLWQHPLDYMYQQIYIEEKKKSGSSANLMSPAPGGAPGVKAQSSEQAPPVAPGGGGTPTASASSSASTLPPRAAPAEEPPAGAIGDDARLRMMLQKTLGTK